jgi:uncharacterized protein (TIGR02246 family)
MPDQFASPQDAEDAFYDALDDQDLQRMMTVWEASAEIACLLPMQPLARHTGVREAWRPLFENDVKVDVEVHHIQWVEMEAFAIHYVEERVSFAGQPQKSPPVYATNVYRKGNQGWHMILHQNSPMPPPPEMMRGMGPPPMR